MEVMEEGIGKLSFKIPPDFFSRIEFRTVRGQENEYNVVRDDQFFSFMKSPIV